MGWVALIDGVMGDPPTIIVITHDVIQNPKSNESSERTLLNKYKIQCTQIGYDG
jgi:hypothetical protein